MWPARRAHMAHGPGTGAGRGGPGPPPKPAQQTKCRSPLSPKVEISQTAQAFPFTTPPLQKCPLLHRYRKPKPLMGSCKMRVLVVLSRVMRTESRVRSMATIHGTLLITTLEFLLHALIHALKNFSLPGPSWALGGGCVGALATPTGPPQCCAAWQVLGFRV